MRRVRKIASNIVVEVSETRSRNMRAIRSKDTKPEIIVRKLVHALGRRYRLHRPDLPGKPDLVLARDKKVILVHGCFWHGHSDPGCSIVHRPKTNKGYWTPKLRRNRSRDESNLLALKALGWQTLTVWECETRDKALLDRRLRSFLR